MLKYYLFDRLELVPFFVFRGQYPRRRHAELEAFSAHVLDQDPQLHKTYRAST